MRYLVLSDIHSNLDAFETVLEDAGDWDETLFLGDLVGYGPNPNECAELLLRQPNLTSVVGNHDVAALGQIDLGTFNEIAKIAAEWTQRNMSEDTKAYLKSLGQIEELPEITLVHGSPRDPLWEYMNDACQAPMNFARFTTPICFVGHTHVPKIFQQDVEMRRVTTINPSAAEVVEADDISRLIINPGSVGQPRDGDPHASYGLFDTDRGAFELRRVTYDVPSTQDRIGKAGLPKELADRLEHGL